MTINNKKKPGRPRKIVSGDLSRWTILIPWETRISVTKAAERQQMNLNAWIDKALREFLVEKDIFLNELLEQSAQMEELSALLKVKRPWWKRLRS